MAHSPHIECVRVRARVIVIVYEREIGKERERESIYILAGVAGASSCTGMRCFPGSYGSPGMRGVAPCG